MAVESSALAVYGKDNQKDIYLETKSKFASLCNFIQVTINRKTYKTKLETFLNRDWQ